MGFPALLNIAEGCLRGVAGRKVPAAKGRPARKRGSIYQECGLSRLDGDHCGQDRFRLQSSTVNQLTLD